MGGSYTGNGVGMGEKLYLLWVSGAVVDVDIYLIDIYRVFICSASFIFV